MAFDQATRNKLQNFVSNARTLLTAEFTRQLQNDYGMDPDTGEISNFNSLTHLNDTQIQTARLLRDTLKHYQTGISSNDSKEILCRIVREQAFTVLNRLCAMRLAETRGILIESIGKGYNSKGFQLYTRVAGTSLGETGDTYRNYLFSLFDEFAYDLAVLFDRYSPMGRLFPRESALLELIDKINDVELEALWVEDETIGWIYQYFNSAEERKQMRAESQAPRNSRELAVRNQFFTPRYVVEFLTDNTLGRIWYEMTKGNTVLIDRCRYLVRRPNEIFLEKGDEAPKQKDTDADLSQEELLKQPVYITHRPIKDPRKILMLDPACGSMHFGLYAFDLFEKIYEEAWNLQSSGQWQGVVNKRLALLTETYATRDELLRDVPRLIIENNIHGIDIDPRAVQIAGLSLWLRAQRSWKEHNVKHGERPQIQKSNIVCAEPMPGDKGLLKEFSESLKPKVLGQLLEIIFEKMELAGEAGSLLKIEEEIEEAVENAREEFNREILRRKEEAGYLPGMAPKRQPTLFDFADLPDKTQFWETAEEKILNALRNYAEQTEEGDNGRRRLFVEDAAKGFAFIDICRKRFDVVLMNPPFGNNTSSTTQYNGSHYPESKNDIFSMFVDRGTSLLKNDCLIGAITPRTAFFLSSFLPWRNKFLFENNKIQNLADLGHGVMDNAMVKAAAYTIRKSPKYDKCHCFNLLDSNNKSELIQKILNDFALYIDNRYFFSLIINMSNIPNKPFAYWITKETLDLFDNFHQFDDEQNGRATRCGLGTLDDFRFLRLSSEITYNKRIANWTRYFGGGTYSPIYEDNSIFVDWTCEGNKIKRYVEFKVGSASRKVQGEDHYFLPGFVFPRRTNAFSPKVLPKNAIFSTAGQAGFLPSNDIKWGIALLSSSIINQLIELSQGGGGGVQFEVGIIKRLPWPEVNDDQKMYLEDSFMMIFNSKLKRITYEEGSTFFLSPFVVDEKISKISERMNQNFKTLKTVTFKEKIKIDDIAMKLYGLKNENVKCEIDLENEQTNGIQNQDLKKEISIKIMSYLLGSNFGRWDIQYTTSEKEMPDLADPLNPLPLCPPGMLKNSEGLPSERKDIPTDYPLRITWSGIIVNDEGHPEDILTRVREALEVIWKDKASDIEQEACEILKIRSLSEYFSKPAKFFADHLKRYSKSRRQAPIYWPLSTPSGSYTLWLYYHRLTNQILYTCVNDFVEPKLKFVSETTDHLRKKTGRTSQEEKELEKYSDLELELKDFRDELLRIAKFWKPNLNDGVQITAAPLWKLFQHKPWQKKLKQTWKKLEKGEYDWAHLAYSIWPERVINASHKDRSYAIAHDLEEDLWEGIKNGIDRQGNPKYKWVPKDLSENELKTIIIAKIGENT